MFVLEFDEGLFTLNTKAPQFEPLSQLPDVVKAPPKKVYHLQERPASFS